MVLLAAPGTPLNRYVYLKEVIVMFSSYRVQKFLVLVGLYATIGIVVSIKVGDLAMGFGLATVGCVVLYAAAVELTK
jgi:hypothetical protein